MVLDTFSKYERKEVSDGKLDLCLCELRLHQRSSKSRQWTTYGDVDCGATTERHQIHYSRLLPRYLVLCDSETRGGRPIDQTHEPGSKASNDSLVYLGRDDSCAVRMRDHSLRTVHTFTFAVGLFSEGRVLVDLGLGGLRNLRRR